MTKETTPASGVETLEQARVLITDLQREISELKMQLAARTTERDAARHDANQHLQARLQWEQHGRRETARADLAGRELAKARGLAGLGWGTALVVGLAKVARLR